jgi:hypothetical protein
MRDVMVRLVGDQLAERQRPVLRLVILPLERILARQSEQLEVRLALNEREMSFGISAIVPNMSCGTSTVSPQMRQSFLRVGNSMLPSV